MFAFAIRQPSAVHNKDMTPTFTKMLSRTTPRLVSSVSATLRRQLATSAVWSGSLTFASPEADFTIGSVRSFTSNGPSWSSQLSFSSPEADFTAIQARTASSLAKPEWTGDLSFSSPEADFSSGTFPHKRVSPFKPRDASWSGALSFASPESDWCAEASAPPAAHRLPRTLKEALLDESAAIVVTTASAPHNIVHVNHAWEELCGFTKQEVLDKSLSIIQGPESNTELAQSMVQRLDAGVSSVEMYLINYRKSGEAFTNHVSMGHLFLNEDSKDVEFLVGILEEVRPDQVPLRLVC